MILYRQR